MEPRKWTVTLSSVLVFLLLTSSISCTELAPPEEPVIEEEEEPVTVEDIWEPARTPPRPRPEPVVEVVVEDPEPLPEPEPVVEPEPAPKKNVYKPGGSGPMYTHVIMRPHIVTTPLPDVWSIHVDFEFYEADGERIHIYNYLNIYAEIRDGDNLIFTSKDYWTGPDSRTVRMCSSDGGLAIPNRLLEPYDGEQLTIRAYFKDDTFIETVLIIK